MVLWHAGRVRDQVVIDPRFRGPPDSANGGYACSLLAGCIDGPARVSLRRPPPLGRRLERERRDDGTVVLRDGETRVAEAAPAVVEVDVPAPVSLADAELATAGYAGLHDHPFPGCFVCGPDRAPGDGLRIFCGPVAGRDVFAAPWIPDPSLGDDQGRVRDAFVWCALDCPSGNAITSAHGLAPVLLGRLAVRIDGPVAVGEPHVLMSWTLAHSGRKHDSAAALLAADGTLLAVSEALWIDVPET